MKDDSDTSNSARALHPKNKHERKRKCADHTTTLRKIREGDF